MSEPIICPACGRANVAGARTCANCATVLTPGAGATGDENGADWKRLAAQEAVYGSEFGTVQGGAWGQVSTERKSGELPLPPQVQAEALRREREEAQAKAVAARAKREEEEQAQRREADAVRASSAAAAKKAAVSRRCARCGATSHTSEDGTNFSFCLLCGGSFADNPITQSSVPPVIVPPTPTVTSPVGVLQQQARREVRAPYAPRTTVVPQVRVREQGDILPFTEATPYVAAVLSFLLPGMGQLRNAQWSKGFLILLMSFLLLSLLPIGVWSVTAIILRGLVAIDAFRIADRRRRGQTIAPWRWDAGLLAER
ncbi:MAG: hypothetical protein H7Y38_12825 [Armatimonadetes bacterium]|nr:hypothetical protein [Armatimonadota bacterium]